MPTGMDTPAPKPTVAVIGAGPAGLMAAEGMSGSARQSALTALAGTISAAGSSDAGKVQMLAEAVRMLAAS